MIATLELATERARLFPSTYKKLKEMAKSRRTSIAFVIEELLEAAKGKKLPTIKY